MSAKLKIRKGDKVVVTSGVDRGKKGDVIKVFPKTGRIIVSGVRMVKKHTKPSQASSGGIVSKELPIAISNVSYVDPKEGVATKIGFKTLKDGKKVRFAKKSGEVVES